MDDYKVIRPLGQGTYGRVYLVERVSDKARLVIKQIPFDGMKPHEQEEILNEVRVMSRIDHPVFVKYYESFIEKGLLSIVMEYAPEGDLGGVIRRFTQAQTSIPEATLWKYLIQLCQGLSYLHSLRILHRDLKPQNVFLAAHDKIKIGDLGLGRILGSQSGMARTGVGTPLYFSPELCEDRPYDHKSDIWAIGCLLYELMTLRPPFIASNQIALAKKIVGENPLPLPSNYSTELKFLVMKMLEKDTKKRPLIDHILNYSPVRLKISEENLRLKEEKLAEQYTALERKLDADFKQKEQDLLLEFERKCSLIRESQDKLEDERKTWYKTHNDQMNMLKTEHATHQLQMHSLEEKIRSLENQLTQTSEMTKDSAITNERSIWREEKNQYLEQIQSLQQQINDLKKNESDLNLLLDQKDSAVRLYTQKCALLERDQEATSSIVDNLKEKHTSDKVNLHKQHQEALKEMQNDKDRLLMVTSQLEARNKELLENQSKLQDDIREIQRMHSQQRADDEVQSEKLKGKMSNEFQHRLEESVANRMIALRAELEVKHAKALADKESEYSRILSAYQEANLKARIEHEKGVASAKTIQELEDALVNERQAAEVMKVEAQKFHNLQLQVTELRAKLTEMQGIRSELENEVHLKESQIIKAEIHTQDLHSELVDLRRDLDVSRRNSTNNKHMSSDSNSTPETANEDFENEGVNEGETGRRTFIYPTTAWVTGKDSVDSSKGISSPSTTGQNVHSESAPVNTEVSVGNSSDSMSSVDNVSSIRLRLSFSSTSSTEGASSSLLNESPISPTELRVIAPDTSFQETPDSPQSVLEAKGHGVEHRSCEQWEQKASPSSNESSTSQDHHTRQDSISPKGHLHAARAIILSSVPSSWGEPVQRVISKLAEATAPIPNKRQVPLFLWQSASLEPVAQLSTDHSVNDGQSESFALSFSSSSPISSPTTTAYTMLDNFLKHRVMTNAVWPNKVSQYVRPPASSFIILYEVHPSFSKPSRISMTKFPTIRALRVCFEGSLEFVKVPIPKPVPVCICAECTCLTEKRCECICHCKKHLFMLHVSSAMTDFRAVSQFHLDFSSSNNNPISRLVVLPYELAWLDLVQTQNANHSTHVISPKEAIKKHNSPTKLQRYTPRSHRRTPHLKTTSPRKRLAPATSRSSSASKVSSLLHSPIGKHMSFNSGGPKALSTPGTFKSGEKKISTPLRSTGLAKLGPPLRVVNSFKTNNVSTKGAASQDFMSDSSTSVSLHPSLSVDEMVSFLDDDGLEHIMAPLDDSFGNESFGEEEVSVSVNRLHEHQDDAASDVSCVNSAVDISPDKLAGLLSHSSLLYSPSTSKRDKVATESPNSLTPSPRWPLDSTQISKLLKEAHDYRMTPSKSGRHQPIASVGSTEKSWNCPPEVADQYSNGLQDKPSSHQLFRTPSTDQSDSQSHRRRALAAKFHNSMARLVPTSTPPSEERQPVSKTKEYEFCY